LRLASACGQTQPISRFAASEIGIVRLVPSAGPVLIRKRQAGGTATPAQPRGRIHAMAKQVGTRGSGPRRR
jgi:hypothetical protein